ncbi:hypothetical protein DCCM_2234 [Desulfocucumis palustris]|uniref:Uncharacterized protein n=1 Tax=Desulfocucumis palustris TaxID=1898651 RepID=A0A2L2XA27_9FIRM|nr:hypothetical protein DCCM_2234 [Desulfocucumis palustris]
MYFWLIGYSIVIAPYLIFYLLYCFCIVKLYPVPFIKAPY